MALLKSKEERTELREAREQAAEARRQRDANPARRWEHRVVWITKSNQKGALGSGNMERRLNKAGAQGWELVTLEQERAVFKREVTAITAAELEELEAEDDG